MCFATLDPNMATSEGTTRGRPRAFDTDDALDRSMTVFWRLGFNATTTRVLENELGISQSSLYNAFGSKEELFEQAIDHYQNQLDRVVLAHLDRPDPSRESIIDFVDAVVEWIRDDDHRGCLVLNYATESEEGTERMRAYRARLRDLFRPALLTFTTDPADVEARTEVLVAAILGLNISARSGADAAELRQLGQGIQRQVATW